MASSTNHEIDSHTQCLDDFDLGIEARRVTQEVEHMVRIVTIKKNALGNVQGRVAALYATLLDQGVNAVRALRRAFLGKIRLCEAERAISRALGAAPLCSAIEQHSAKQERDAARGMASQLKLRVQVLRLFQGLGSGKMLKSTYLRLEDSLGVLSSELTDLAERHHTLIAMLSSQKGTVLRDRMYASDEKLQLEARWTHVSNTLDSLNDKLMTSKYVPCVTLPDLVLLTESQARSDALHQLCLEIEQTGSLLS